MAELERQNNLAIFAYASLLSDAGEQISPHVVERISCPSPWPIEYARRAKLRGHGPTLVMNLQMSVLNDPIESLSRLLKNPAESFDGSQDERIRD